SATYQASYSGDATYAATVSPTVTVAYLGQGPGITLTSSAKPALPGQTIAITATLATSEGNAMIALYDGANLLGFQELYSAQTIFYFSLPAGTHRLRAVLPQFYGTGSVSPVLTEQVTAPTSGGQLVAGPVWSTATSSLYPAPPGTLIAGDFNNDGYFDLEAFAGMNLVEYKGSSAGAFGDSIFGISQTDVFSFQPGAIARLGAASPYTPNGT